MSPRPFSAIPQAKVSIGTLLVGYLTCKREPGGAPNVMYTYGSQYFARIGDLTNRMYSYGHTLQFPNLSTVGLNYYCASYRSYNLLSPPRDGILRQLMICNDMQFDTKIIGPSKVVFKIISPALLSGASPPKAIKQHTKTPIKTHTEACPKKLPQY